MKIEVNVPSLLRDSVGGRSSFMIEGSTLSEVLAQLREDYPHLHIHLYQQDGKLRPHVLVFYNDESIKRMADLDIPLKPGDHIDIVQSVSGG